MSGRTPSSFHTASTLCDRHRFSEGLVDRFRGSRPGNPMPYHFATPGDGGTTSTKPTRHRSSRVAGRLPLGLHPRTTGPRSLGWHREVLLHDLPTSVDACEHGGPRALDDVRLIVGRDVRNRPRRGQRRGVLTQPVHVDVAPDPARVAHVLPDVPPERGDTAAQRVRGRDHLPSARGHHTAGVGVERGHALDHVGPAEVVRFGDEPRERVGERAVVARRLRGPCARRDHAQTQGRRSSDQTPRVHRLRLRGLRRRAERV